MIALLITALLLALILARVPVAFAILTSGITGLIAVSGPSSTMAVLETIPQSSVSTTALSAIPLFILMAQFILHSGALTGLFDSARILIGRVSGGTAYAAVAAGAVFASVSGSSTASAVTLAHTSTDKMIEQGYSKRLSAGTIAAAGTLAAMIPPSVLLIFYAITAETGVGETLLAGLIPGCMVALALMLTVAVLIARRGGDAPRGEAFGWNEKFRSLAGIAPMLVLFAVVIGFVFFGITTATEAAAIGAVGGLILMAAKRRLTWERFAAALSETVSSSVMIMTIVFSAQIFGHFLTESKITVKIVNFLSNIPIPALATVALIAVVYLILGFFMDQMAIIALTVPITLPVVVALGYDPIWFGVVVILFAEIGLITPPLGLNVFVVARAARLKVETVFAGSIPFVFAILTVGIILFLFPGIVTALQGLS